MTKQEKYIKEIKDFLNKYFKDNVFEHKTLNYVNQSSYEIRENSFIIKTKNAGFNIKEIEVIDREYNLNNANDLQYLQLCSNN